MKLGSRLTLALGAVAVLLFAAGCAPGIATGGGTIPAADPSVSIKGASFANFGFWGDSCDGSVSGNFNYHDKSVFFTKKAPGLKMVGPIQDVWDCTNAGNDAEGLVACGLCEEWIYDNEIPVDVDVSHLSAAKAHYYSTNPAFPGDGTVWACVLDNGEGHNAEDDYLGVLVEDGPYDGYINWGPVSGNLQSYECPPPPV